MKSHTVIRPPAVSGLFYSGDPVELRREIAGMLQKAGRKELKGKVRGIVSPHAGYVYSGQTAARAYSLLQGTSYGVVVVISPSHQEFFEGVSVYPGDAYRTPLGEVKVHSSLRESLVQRCGSLEMSERGHRWEHAIEVQLPFLQQVLEEFTVLPLVIGSQRHTFCFELGETLADVLRGHDYLLVASTDLSHYHSGAMADRLDRIVVDRISTFDYKRLMEDLESGKAEACGGGPVVSVMVALDRLGVRTMEVLHHCNSGDVTGEYDRVVGYLSAVACA